jgi:hypothetical protein
MCEHAFDGPCRERVRAVPQQLNAGHLELALTYAADLRTIQLGDALRIVELMALDSDSRFSKAAARWIERYRAETGAGLSEVQLAAAAFGRLWEEPESELALTALRALVRR